MCHPEPYLSWKLTGECWQFCRMLKKSVQQGRRRVETGRRTLLRYVEDFDEPRTPLAGFFSIRLEEAAFFEVVFVDHRGRFRRKLSPLLQQSFNVFANQIR